LTGAGWDHADDEAIEPASIDVDRQKGVTLTWADGHVAQFDLLELRMNCPCAACREYRRTGDTVWPRAGAPERLALLDAHLVGAFGMGLSWNDGHHTGIYTWDALRAWSTS
jgi:ATP-binding protein involved in chromosome partitioning